MKLTKIVLMLLIILVLNCNMAFAESFTNSRSSDFYSNFKIAAATLGIYGSKDPDGRYGVDVYKNQQNYVEKVDVIGTVKSQAQQEMVSSLVTCAIISVGLPTNEVGILSDQNNLKETTIDDKRVVYSAIRSSALNQWVVMVYCVEDDKLKVELFAANQSDIEKFHLQ